MSSPAYTIYQRTVKFSLLLILVLSFSAALIQFLLKFNTNIEYRQQQLELFAQQMDAQIQPLLQFADAVKNRAQLGMQVSDSTATHIPLLSFSTTEVMLHQLETGDELLNRELQMLQQLQPYFAIAPASISPLKNLYYISEQGFAYNGQQKWSDYVIEQLIEWMQHYQRSENGYDRNPVFYKSFILQQAAMSAPLYVNERKMGRFVLALELSPLLELLEKNNPERYFLLLDQAGEVIASSQVINGVRLEQYQLQIHRLTGLPWSLAIIDKTDSSFGAALASFLIYWLSYAVVLLIMGWFLARRYKRKIIGPLQRLSVHVDRLANNQPGVRRIPEGWHTLFDRVTKLRADDKQNTD